MGKGGSRPRPLGASLPPPAACGPLPLPALGGLGAARPARLRRSGKCGGGRRLRRLRSSRRLPLLGGTLPQSKAKPLRGRSAGLALLLPLAGCGVGAPGRPGPHEWGLWGRPPLRPGRACLRPAAPRWPACGAACAAAALPPLGPPGVAAPPAAASRRRSAGGVRASLACGPCPGPWPSRSARPVRGRNLDAARKGLARVAGRGPISAPRAAVARGYAACGRVCHVADHPTRPSQAAGGGPCLMICAVAQCNQGRCIALK